MEGVEITMTLETMVDSSPTMDPWKGTTLVAETRVEDPTAVSFTLQLRRSNIKMGHNKWHNIPCGVTRIHFFLYLNGRRLWLWWWQRRWLWLTAILIISCFGKLHSVSHHSPSTVQSEPMKVQNNNLFYPVSIQQASVLSRRGEEVSKGIVRKAAGYFEAVIWKH